MERVRLKVPKSDSIYKTELQVRVGDLNYGKHVGNDRILLYCHEIRNQFFQSIGQSELSFFDTSLIMSDSTCVYKSQGYWKDIIEATLYLEGLTETSFRLFYLLNNKETQKPIAYVTTTLVFFNYEKNKIDKVDLNRIKLV